MDSLALGLIIGFSIFGGLLICCSPILCFTYKMYTNPAATFLWLNKKGREKAKWETKSITINNYTYSYLESIEPTPQNNKKKSILPLKEREVIVMIHGFSSNKDAWNAMTAHLCDQYHCIAIDLVGHGETLPKQADNYKMETQATRLNGVIKALVGDRMIHIIGTSMGGHVVGVYAARYPEQVASLCLLCCAGVEGANKARLVTMFETTGRNFLLPKNLDEFMEMFAHVFVKVPRVPRPLARHMWEMRQTNATLYEKIMSDMIEDGYLLQTLLPMIKAPTQVQWGVNDNVLDVSAVEILKKDLPTTPDVVIFQQCGHGLQLEKARESMQEYKRWLKTLTPSSVTIVTSSAAASATSSIAPLTEKSSLIAAAVPTTVPGAIQHDSSIDVTIE